MEVDIGNVEDDRSEFKRAIKILNEDIDFSIASLSAHPDEEYGFIISQYNNETIVTLVRSEEVLA